MMFVAMATCAVILYPPAALSIVSGWACFRSVQDKISGLILYAVLAGVKGTRQCCGASRDYWFVEGV